MLRHFTSAPEFVEALAPHQSPLPSSGGPSMWDTGWRNGSWLYRGQACAEWGLDPSAFRDGAYDWLPWYGWYKRHAWPHPQELLEFEAFKTFVQRSDEAGLALPEDGQTFRRLLDKWQARLRSPDKSGSGGPDPKWPPSPFLSALALAKHHGIATRLLDWSRSPYVAAWFAASEAVAWVRSDYARAKCQCRERCHELAVWVLNGRALQFETMAQEDPRHKVRTGYRLRIVTAPTASNRRLSAQRGCFTLVRTGVTPPFRDVSIGLEKAVELPDAWLFGRSPLAAGMRFPGVDALVKFTLPHAEAETLLKALDAHGVSAATVYPGYDGVAEALKNGAR